MFAAALVSALIASAGASSAASSIRLPVWMTMSAQRADPEAVGKLLDGELGRAGAAAWNKERFFDPREPNGNGSTRWYFVRPANQIEPPPAAVRFEVSEQVPYSVNATVYCGDVHCTGLMETLSKLPPPVPGRTASAELRADWLHVIEHEPCKTGKSETTAGAYPTEELRRHISGRAELRLVTNACGEVRGVAITKSSGNRNLDRAARRQALTWRLPPGRRFWSTWVEFGGSSGWEAKDESVVNGEFVAATSLDP
jgi:TonB family protein